MRPISAGQSQEAVNLGGEVAGKQFVVADVAEYGLGRAVPGLAHDQPLLDPNRGGEPCPHRVQFSKTV
jgi:hypothetical protein